MATTKFKDESYTVKIANRIVNNLIDNPNKRGLLLYHSENNCILITIADTLFNKFPNQYTKVNVFTVSTLYSNFISEYCSLCGHRPDNYKDYYQFWMYNTDNIQNQLENVDLSNSIIIINDSHLLITDFAHKSPKGLNIYNRLMKARNVKLILATNTPIRYVPQELAYTFNLLYKDPLKGFGNLSSEFSKYIKGNLINLSIINLPGFMRKIKDLTSYEPKKGTFSTLTEQIYIFVNMTPEQAKLYFKIRKKENQWLNEPCVAQSLKIIAIKQILSRRASNIYVPNNLKTIGYKFDNSYVENFHDVYYGTHSPTATVNNKVPPPPDTLIIQKTEPRGWISDKYLSNLNEFAPKFYKLLENILKLIPGKHIVYTEYKKRGGISVISSMLSAFNVSNFIYSKTPEYTKNFNKDEDESIKVLIITNTIPSHINLLGVRYLHILDPFNNYTDYRCLIGTIKTNKKIEVYNYFSILPNDDDSYSIKELATRSSDIYQYLRGKMTEINIKKLEKLLIRSSFN